MLRQLGRDAEAEKCIAKTCELDPLDNWSRYLATGVTPPDGQQRLDLALDLLRCSLLVQTKNVLLSGTAAKDGSDAMLLYALAHVYTSLGLDKESADAYRSAASANAEYVFPSRLEEILLLEAAMTQNPEDARAPILPGNLLYDRRRHKDAIQLWERAVELDPDYPTAWRNPRLCLLQRSRRRVESSQCVCSCQRTRSSGCAHRLRA